MKPIKAVQYIAFGMSLVAFSLSIRCISHTCSFGSNDMLLRGVRPIFFNITDSVWNISGVKIYLAMHLAFSIVFYLIGLALGLRLLPKKLTETERAEAFQAPYAAFKKVFFSKALFGGITFKNDTVVDLRHYSLDTVADLYLLNFTMSNKANGLFLILFLGFFIPAITDLEPRSSYGQLFFNFLFTNLLLLSAFEVSLYLSSKFIAKGKNNERRI